MPDRYRLTRVTLTSLLKTLAAAGLPGASLAADAVDQAAQVLDARRAWDEAADALARAEKAFRREAAGRGWADLADALAQLPVHNLPAFEAALRAALGAGDPQALQAALRDQLAVLPGVDDPALAAQAARLYAAHVLDALWQVDALRGAVRDLLFKEQTEALRRLEDQLALAPGARPPNPAPPPLSPRPGAGHSPDCAQGAPGPGALHRTGLPRAPRCAGGLGRGFYWKFLSPCYNGNAPLSSSLEETCLAQQLR